MTVNPLPLLYTVMGGGSYCAGDTGVHVKLSGSVAGNNYQLFYGGTAIGTAISGTGLSLDFGLHTAAGTYKIVATDAITACSNNMFDSAIVTINPLPAAIAGSTKVCTGLTTPLSDGTTGGTWSSSNTTLAAIGTSGVVTGLAIGTSTITYTLSTGCITTASVVVNPLPVSITGTASVCAGLTTTLSDGTPGGAWSSGSTAIATIVSTSGTLTGVSGGASVITYTLPTGCVATKTATVNPLPSPIAGTAVCVNATTGLSDLSTGGTWNTGNTTIVTIAAGTGVVTGVSAGTAIVTYTLPTGCIATTNVTVNPLPYAGTITGASDVCPDSMIILSDAIKGGVWTSSNFKAIISVSGVVAGLKIGTDTIIYSVTNVCGTDNAIWVLNIIKCDFTNVPVVANSSSQLLVFPNPNEGVFTVNLLSDYHEQLSIMITNLLGQKVKEITAVTNNPVNIKLDVAAGVYLISGTTAHGKYVGKVTVNP